MPAETLTAAKTKTVLLVEDETVISDPIAACLRMAGYPTVVAASGEEALDALRSQEFGLVLLDVLLPAMSGLAVLRQMRADARTAKVPVILLTAAEGRREILEAAKYGARDYLLKSHFSLKELLARVRKQFGQDTPATAAAPAQAQPVSAPASAPVMMTAATAAAPATGSLPCLSSREQCIRRAEEALHGKTLSGVVAQVISTAASPRSDLSQLASIVGRDPVLSVRVLRAANSASVASARGAVSNVTDAIRQIGSGTVRNIAATVGVFDAMPAGGAESFNPVRCWQHSFAVAKLCEHLAGDAGKADGSAYLVGLCHDLSDILLQTEFGMEYRRVTEAQEKLGKSREEVERAMLGITHAELSATVLRCVGLPESVRAPIEAFHAGRRAQARGAHPLSRILRLADWYANGLLLASGGASPVGPLEVSACQEITGDKNPPVPDGDSLRAEVFALTAALGRLPASEEKQVLAPPYPKRDVRVFLARCGTFSAFDPIAAALASLANVTASPALPSVETLANYAAVVVVSPDLQTPGFRVADVQRLQSGASRPPLLWLANGGSAQQADPGVRDGITPLPMPWPIPLSTLAEFVRTI